MDGGIPTSSRPVEERMCLLGISDSDYQKYEEMFLRPRERYHYIIRTLRGWVTRKYPWDENLVLRHLTNENTIGLYPADQLNHLMININRHDHETKANLRSRIKKVRKVIGGKPLMYQSSPSGGIRLCYFLSNPVSRELLYQRYKDLLSEKNVNVKPGEIEMQMPTDGGSNLTSFSVKNGVFHCFAYAESGDVITLIQKLCNLDFPEAVEYLAQRVGISSAEFKIQKWKPKH
jgi:hypothetical protein